MTATDLFQLVSPLIGTGCEPECHYNSDAWWDSYGQIMCDEAAAAMWEVAIMDWLLNEQRRAFFIAGPVVSFPDMDVMFDGPTRLHALVEAAKKVMVKA